ncbi:MAG: hypothetical protein LBG78_01500 [Azoarcus sp.]|jgi:predicted hotdog family 3-hydroxylacyl-ACP dehydratase|nr:hypothetical protein [Azoarcus sp.]
MVNSLLSVSGSYPHSFALLVLDGVFGETWVDGLSLRYRSKGANLRSSYLCGLFMFTQIPCHFQLFQRLRRALVSGLLVLIACQGTAKAGDETANAPDAEAPPATKRIEQLRGEAKALRDKATAEYRKDETACYKRFLVNRCIDNAKSKRLESIVQARELEAEAHKLDIVERKRIAEEKMKKAGEHGNVQRLLQPTPPSEEAPPPVAPDAGKRASRAVIPLKPFNAEAKAREQAARRAEANRRAEAARRDRERYNARIRELEEKKKRDADGR